MISVVMPVFLTDYAQLPVLKKSIQSIVDQTYSDWELIIVDDGSGINFSYPDDSRIKYFRKKHEGIAKARNFGIQKMKGSVYTPQDADDYSYPNRLQKINEILKHGDVVYCSFYKVYGVNGEKRVFVPSEPFNLERLKKEQYISGYVAVKKKKLIPFREEFDSHDDWIFLLDLARIGAKFVRIEEPLFDYLLTDYSTSVKDYFSGKHNLMVNKTKQLIHNL